MNDNTKMEEISKFLEGRDPQEYITGIEGDYNENEVHLMIEHPEKGKYIEKHKFTPFVFVRDFKALNEKLYSSKDDLNKAMDIHGISISSLRTDKHPRLEWGYKYLIKTSKKLKNITQFFAKAGHDLWHSANRLFLYNTGLEQFLISTGKRLFKGFDSYNQLHKFYFDIETTGLNPLESNIFLIGMKDNRGFQKVLSIDSDNPLESERQMIIDFFQIIYDLKPTVVAGYNSEAFDFYFILERAKILGIDLGDRKDEEGNRLYDVRTSLNSNYPIKRRNATFKHGSETEHYEATIMWGINVIDISHGVKKAMAINSDIKGWGLKYICQFSEIAKGNRMYVKDGNQIYKIWNNNKQYFINKKNNKYKEIPDKFQTNPEDYKLKLIEWVKKGEEDSVAESIKKVYDFFDGNVDNVDTISGKEIIYQYLLDDIWETEQVDNRFNEATFMLGKIAPTSFSRASTIGNASLWKMLLLTYSYENNLAIPITDLKRDIVGGLSRLVRSGYAKNVLKMDFTSLYPGIQLTHDVFPDLDITNVLENILTYFRNARIEFKGLSKKYKDEGNKELAKFYDTKQLPIKILANSNFGAVSSPAIFNWGDNNIGERITCTGRLYLRLMIKHFMEYKFTPLVMDTDGVNFSIPDDVDNITYINKKGEEVIGYKAVLAEFNEKYMKGVMNLEEDGIYAATINFRRKNYANLTTSSKVKLTGASIKSKTIQAYIAEFLDKGIELLLNGDGKGFVEAYYEYISLIYNRQIPLIKIANKDKVKLKVADYKWKMENVKNKNGKPATRQVHMELVIEHGLEPDLGDVIYHVNNGTKKSHGNLGNSYLLNMKELETDPNRIGEYNVAKYIDAFNSRLEPILVVLQKEVRETLLINNPKDRQYYTDSQLELVSGQPLEVEHQDPLTIDDYIAGQHENEPVFEMSEAEIIYWNKTGLDPIEIFDGFTTELSTIRLLTQEEQKIKKEQSNKIIDFFSQQGLKVKTEMDFLLNNDDVIVYKNKFTKFIKNPNYKPDSYVKNEKDEFLQLVTELDDFRWILSKYQYYKDTAIFNDIDYIDEDIYA